MTYDIIALHSLAKDNTGLIFGRLTAIAPVERATNKRIKWLCICQCGTEVSVEAQSLHLGKTKSCGCIHSEVLIKRNSSHGRVATPEYYSWGDLIQRCDNPNNIGYHNYGGRGITYDKRWSSFELFFKDMGKKPTRKHTLDRMNNEGNYKKNNCRWATRAEQSRNTRRNRHITAFGETQLLCEWAREGGVASPLIAYRLDHGWSPERAVSRSTEQEHRSKAA